MTSPEETVFTPSVATKLTRVLAAARSDLDSTGAPLLTSMMFMVQPRTEPKDLMENLSEPESRNGTR